MPSVTQKANWPAENVVMKHISALVPYARNARKHSPQQVDQIAASIQEWGWTMPVLVDENGTIIAGHGRVMAAHKLGITDVPTMIATGWNEAKRRAYALADNQLTLNSDWDLALLQEELQALDVAGFDLPLVGFSDDQLASFSKRTQIGNTDPDDVPDTPPEPVTTNGDVWLMGQHKLACRSCSDESARDFFGPVDVVCTDPPYCSGGFQESGKAAGSVGRRIVKKEIVNDKLSTRGYQGLMKSGVLTIDASFFYIFTDWRMWAYLFDLAESSGAGVRSMIVWNKGSAGMGAGWRSQHELVLFARRKNPAHDAKAPSSGNVITMNRQKNELHTTQKPVELLRALLKVTPAAQTVADPFCGSGSTIIACEMDSRECKATEIDPAYVDVAVRRWQSFTGQDATHQATGQPFVDIANERRTQRDQPS